MRKTLFFSVVFIFFPKWIVLAQTVEISGKITDAEGEILPFTNIIADPLDTLQRVRYTVSDKNGHYKIRLKKDFSYRISATYMGYAPQTKRITAKRDTVVNFVLEQSEEQLNTVVITARKSIDVKEDTITFRADAFRKGDERKLRDLLENIPGMEVDDEGNVKFQGRKVSMVLVENQTFFTGNTKLAVNHLPSDAVNEIQILDNYNRTAFMKHVSSSDKIALNINLKEDKKKFWFGSVDAGLSRKYYLLHSALFRYSPIYQLVFLGDANNAGLVPMSYNDFYEFNKSGDSYDLMESFSLSRTYNNLFGNQNYIQSAVKFGAFHIRKFFNYKSNLSAYIIANQSENQSWKKEERKIINIDSLFQTRLTAFSEKNNMLISRIQYRHYDKFSHDFEIKTEINFLNPLYNRNIENIDNSGTNHWDYLMQQSNFKFGQTISFKKYYTDDYITDISVKYVHEKNQINETRLFDSFQNPYFNMNIPDSLNLEQNILQKNDEFFFHIKHYYTYRDDRQMIFTTGYRHFNALYSNNLFFSNQDTIVFINDPEIASNQAGNYDNFFVGFAWRVMLGNGIAKIGVRQNFIHWKYHNPRDLIVLKRKLFQPFAKWSYKKEGFNLKFSYQYKETFPSLNNIWPSYYLTDVYNLNVGRGIFMPVYGHQIQLLLSKFDNIKKYMYFINATYIYNPRQYLFEKEFNGFYAVSYFRNVNLFRRNLVVMLNLSKWNKLLRYALNLSYTRGISNNYINHQVKTTPFSLWFAGLHLNTMWDANYPNFNVSYNWSLNHYSEKTATNNIIKNINANLKYKLFHWYFFVKISHQFYNDSDFKLAGSSNNLSFKLRYDNKKYPWIFEFTGFNLLNSGVYYQQNLSGDWLFSTVQGVFPRVWLFKVSYNL